MKLELVSLDLLPQAMEIIDMGKAHLKEQGIDQWDNDYPLKIDLKEDIEAENGYFFKDGDEILGYLCIDFQGEPAYETLQDSWVSEEPYVVVHRLAFHQNARGKKLISRLFALVEALSRQKSLHYFRIDTHSHNKKMIHILENYGFQERGVVRYEDCERIGFDKKF